MTEMCKCKRCGKSPHLLCMPGDLFYVQCHCGKWDPYEFVGMTRESAIKNWNISNSRTPAPRNLIGLED